MFSTKASEAVYQALNSIKTTTSKGEDFDLENNQNTGIILLYATNLNFW